MRLEYRAMAFGLLVGVLACGDMSAPPIHLPAPISGRIDGPVVISDPSESGSITIAAVPGSVPGNATVLIINVTVAQSLSFDHRTEGGSICEKQAHTCVVAGADGSFTFSIAASDGQTIALVVIDPATGEELGERRYITISASGSGDDSGPGAAPSGEDAAREAVAGGGDGPSGSGGSGGSSGSSGSAGSSDGTTTSSGSGGGGSSDSGSSTTARSTSTVSVSGAKGTVSPSSLVLLTNETEVAGDQQTASAVQPLRWGRIQRLVAWVSQLLIGRAHAVSYPSICLAKGRICAFADGDGAFVLTIAVLVGDTISLHVVDPVNGQSERMVFAMIVKQLGEQGGGSPSPGTEPGGTTDGTPGNGGGSGATGQGQGNGKPKK